jgi:hypothetical protein
VFQELKRKVRERNVRLKQHQKRWKAIFKELKRRNGMLVFLVFGLQQEVYPARVQVQKLQFRYL